MTLSKRQYGYLNQRVILFRLQYEIHSLQMHPKSPCRSVVAHTPTLRLVVIICQYFPSRSLYFQPILPSSLSHISSVAVPHLLRRRIHICCPASLPPCSSAAVFAADLVCHPHYPGATVQSQTGSRSLSKFYQSVNVLTTYFYIYVVPYLFCCRPAYPPPAYPSLLSHISATVLVHCYLHL